MRRVALPAGIRSSASTTRRELLAAGGLTAWGALLAQGLSFPAAAAATARPTKACILVFHYGGPSQLETWDPKPDAPAEVRGEFSPIATSAPGVFIGEHLPRMARLMDRVTLVRSLHHGMRNHNSAAAQVLTGQMPSGGDLELLTEDPLGPPNLGATLSAVLGPPAQGGLPHVMLPYVMYNVVQLPGQSAGYLGTAHERMVVAGDPNRPDFSVRVLQRPSEVTAERFAAREALRDSLASERDSAAQRAVDTLYEQAFDVLRSDALQRALDIRQESDPLRERYGRNLLGQSLLLARRLVEGGVRMVTVCDGQSNCQTCNWDSHQDVFLRHRDALLPPVDTGLSALLEDLEQRGLLESTLVVSVGEFGRTPRINSSAGRDHWPDCFSALLAGGGAPRGAVLGRSDRLAAYPDLLPCSPGDLAATLFQQFGIDPHLELHDPTGRPHRLAPGNPLF